MNISKQEILDIIKTGEGFNLEFKEKLNSTIGKEMCAFANASGGKILLGVKDDGSLKSFTLNNTDKSIIFDIARNMDPSLDIDIHQFDDLIVIEIPEGNEKPYFIAGNCYMRIGANSQKLKRDEIKNFFQVQGGLIFDEKFIDYDMKDFSDKAFDRFIEMAGISRKLGKERILENLGFIKDHKMNHSGALFFTKDITKYLRNSDVICVLYQGLLPVHYKNPDVF